MDYDTIKTNAYKPPEKPCDCPKDECTKTSFQYAEVDLPIEVKPSANVGDIKVECVGDPKVVCKEDKGCKILELCISQKVCIKIPVTYKVVACVGESEVECVKCDK